MPSKEKVEAQQDYIDVQFDGEDDLFNPLHFSKGKKWAIVIIISNGSFCATFCSSVCSRWKESPELNSLPMYQVVTACYAQMEERFSSSRLVVTLGLSLFVAGVRRSPSL